MLHIIYFKPMKKSIFLFLIVALAGNYSFAQTNTNKNAKFKSALDYISLKRYNTADSILTELISKDKENQDYILYKGLCELKLGNEDEAIKEFDKITDANQTSQEKAAVTKSAIFYKAEAYHNLYLFDEETEILKKLSAFDLKEKEKAKQKRYFERAENAKVIYNDFKPIIVTRLDILNSAYDDHTPIPTAGGDKLYFTSKRPGGISGETKSDEGKYYEDIWFWDGVNSPVNIGTPINTLKHDATGGLSLDGKTIFIYRTEGNKNGDLYTSKLNADNKWEEPKKLSISQSRYIERHATLSPDGKKLFFSSNRSGGKGGRDIWLSEKAEDGTWGTPVNININTEYDEEAPYILSDGNTFYFSSKGYKNMGGYDIFKCTLQKDGTFSEPENIGFPVNTVEDDVFFFPVSNEDMAYFTRRKTDNADIYKTIFPTNTFIVESIVKGKEEDKKPYSMSADIDIFDINSNTQPDVYTLKHKDHYKSIILPDKEYKIVYKSDGYIFASKNIKQKELLENATIQEYPVLVKIEPGKTEKFETVDFPANSSELDPFTKKELDLIAESMQENEDIVVDFSTEKRALQSTELSQQRKNKAVEYLKNKGIPANRIYTDLSPRNIPENKMEYTLYDTNSVKNLIAKIEEVKEGEESIVANQEEVSKKYYSISIHNMYFKFDKSKLDAPQKTDLDALSSYLAKNPLAKIAVIGYTDAVGSYQYNELLAKRRAEDVKRYVLNHGAKDNQIITLGFGEDNPVSYNKRNGRYFEPSKQFNRRVEFRIIKQGTPKLQIVQFNELPNKYKDPNYDANYEK